MPKLVLRKPWTSQPQQPKAVDASLAPKFVISTLGGGPPREHVNGVNGALVGGANTVPSQVGVGQKLDGTSGYVEFASATPYELLGAMTLVWHGIINSTAGYNFLLARSSGNGALNNPFELRSDQTTGFLNLTRANAADFGSWISSVAVPVGVPVTIVVTQGGDISTDAGTSFYINGANAAFTRNHTSTSAGNASGNTQPLRLGTRGDLFAYAATTLGLCAGFDRILPDALIKSLSSNAWQLFTAEPRRLFVPAATAGTTITCTVGAASAVGVSSRVNSTLQAGVAAASAVGVTALVSRTLQTTVGAAAATGVNAQVSVTLQASVAAAGATGVTALLNASVSASVGAAGATGVTAQTAVTISAGPGNASATGVNALLPVTVACGPGNAAATGVNAVISVAGSTTIVCTVGAAAAVGVALLVNTTLQTAVGAASAQGVAASTNVTLTAAVGSASAIGVTAMGNTSILASIGNASATGVTAVINVAGSATITCTVGSASALGVVALTNATLTTTTGYASAVGITASLQSGNLYQPSRFIGYVPFSSRIGYVPVNVRTGYVPAK